MSPGRAAASLLAGVLLLVGGPVFASVEVLRSLDEVETCVAEIMAGVRQDDQNKALALLQRYANHDDVRVVTHLATLPGALRQALSDAGPVQARQRVGRERFSASFRRITWETRHAGNVLRYMFTWRRVAGSWRLNQLYIAGREH